MDLSINSLLASPKILTNSKAKSKLDQMDKILSKMSSYNTTKVDIEKINREAKLEAKKTFFEEIDCLQLNGLPKLEELDVFGGFNRIASEISKGLNGNQSIFKNQPFLVFKREDFYRDEQFSEKLVRRILGEKRGDKLKMLKTALKMMSLESDLDNLLVIKKTLIDEMVTASIVDVYATLIKILINYGIDLKLLECYVIKYQNIKDNASLKRHLPKEEQQSQSDYDLNMIQSFVHIVDMLEIAVNSTDIHDHQILADYVSIILILYSEKEWRFNLQCLNSLSHLLAFVLRRVGSSTNAIKVVAKAITHFFKGKHTDFFEFLDVFPHNTANLANIKFALCKIALKKYQVKVAHTEPRVDGTFASLKQLKCNPDEMKLVVGLIDHFYQTRELDDGLSQHISDHLAAFAKDCKFGSKENQNSIHFHQYLNDLVYKYDTKPKTTPLRKKTRGAGAGSRPRKTMSEKEVKKIWEELESELNE